MAGSNSGTNPGPPLWLLAELTYRCPLQCAYCSNPIDFAAHGEELSTAEWMRVFREGRDLGAVQLGLSGGEPALRQDLEELVAEAHRLGYYTNLITSGMGLDRARVAALKAAGLDHIQLSIQDSDAQRNDRLAGSSKAYCKKIEIATEIKAQGYPMVLNFVLHRHNIDHIESLLDLSLELEADYVELANTQFYGWGLHNRNQLMPDREQVRRAEAYTRRFRDTRAGAMTTYFIVPDYHDTRPKPCMNGWGAVFLTVTPDGLALPCHSARELPLTFPNVRDHSLGDIWYRSEGFNHYRGDDWMREPCRNCPEKHRDFGGCRCQAFLLTGDATNTDPVCDRSPDHHLVTEAVARAQAGGEDVQPLVLRNSRNSRRLAREENR